MRKAHVLQAQYVSHLPNQDVGSDALIEVITDLGPGEMNSFYMDQIDLEGNKIDIAFVTLSKLHPLNATALAEGDAIEYDIQDGLLHTKVIWNGRHIRQRGYSFDDLNRKSWS